MGMLRFLFNAAALVGALLLALTLAARLRSHRVLVPRVDGD